MNKTFDRYASLAFLALGAGFVYQSQNISQSAYGSNVGPNIFPLGLGVILILLSFRLFFETFRYKAEDGREKEVLDYKRFSIILIAAIGYVLLLEPLGYIISTFFFLLVGFQTMDKGKPLATILIAAAFASGIYIVYVKLLEGTLPGLPAWLGL